MGLPESERAPISFPSWKAVLASAVQTIGRATSVPEIERASVESLGESVWQVILRYGFMEEPDVPAALTAAGLQGFAFDVEETTFFLGLETLLSTARKGMARWRERLFAVMSRNAVRATSFFRIPPERVVELGMQIEL